MHPPFSPPFARLAFALAASSLASSLAAPRAVAQDGAAVASEPQLLNQSSDPRLATFRFRSIGPAAMGGRVDAVAVAPSDANVIYVGYAVGGVFKSTNNATTFEPVFERYSSASIGDIAIHPNLSNALHAVRSDTIGRGRAGLSDDVKAAIAAIAAPLQRRLGYEPFGAASSGVTSPPPGP